MSDPVRAETALRLAGERRLLSGGGRGHWGGGLGQVASALVLLCDLPEEVAAEVVADYALAGSCRGDGLPWFRARRHHAARGPQPARPAPAPPTVVPCDSTLDLPTGRTHVSAVVFLDRSCEVTVRYDGVPAWGRHRGGIRGMGGPPWMPSHATVADDTGAQAFANFSGSGGDGGWEGRWRTDGPLSPHTRWLEIDGVRLELGAAAALAQVRIEPLPDEPLVHRYLWHRMAVTEHGEPPDQLVVDLLVELGVLDPADPVLDELAALTRLVRRGSYRKKGPRVTREPWASLFTGKPRRKGRTGAVPVAAATPEFDGTVVVLYDLQAEEDGFDLQARVVGDGAAMSHGMDEGFTGVPVAWWAQDDRGNSYLGHWGSHGGHGGQEVSGDLHFEPGLDRKARHLTLLPTGLHHRAVIEVPLPEWGRE